MIQITISFFDIGADINATDAYGYTPLMNAAMLGRLDAVKVLIESGADIQKRGQFGYTALHAASQGGYLDVVQALVKYGASVNCKNDDGDIPLILGMFEKRHVIIYVLLFYTAVRGTHAEIIDYLLKAGSDIHQNGWLGQSAVHTASK
jgi:ankyrin repeat protein